MPVKLQRTFLPSELFFLAEDEEIVVIPRQSIDELDLIGLRLPKLQAMRRISIPLWLALLLKKQLRLNIAPPKWLEEDNLKRVYEEEKNVKDRFVQLPWHWMEIGQALLDGAPDDLASPAHVIRNLLRDIREVRQAKTRAGLNELDDSHLQMDNLGLMEINEIRPFVSMVMDELRKIKAVTNDDQEEEEQEDVQDEVNNDQDDYNINDLDDY